MSNEAKKLTGLEMLESWVSENPSRKVAYDAILENLDEEQIESRFNILNNWVAKDPENRKINDNFMPCEKNKKGNWPTVTVAGIPYELRVYYAGKQNSHQSRFLYEDVALRNIRSWNQSNGLNRNFILKSYKMNREEEEGNILGIKSTQENGNYIFFSSVCDTLETINNTISQFNIVGAVHFWMMSNAHETLVGHQYWKQWLLSGFKPDGSKVSGKEKALFNRYNKLRKVNDERIIMLDLFSIRNVAKEDWQDVKDTSGNITKHKALSADAWRLVNEVMNYYTKVGVGIEVRTDRNRSNRGNNNNANRSNNNSNSNSKTTSIDDIFASNSSGMETPPEDGDDNQVFE